ncbi:MAG: FeoA family protein [Clostridia bacterium]|nr:FeoA family protein [Clostridia bacterium]
MNENITLDFLQPGEFAIVKKLKSVGSMRRRLLDIGLINDTVVECVGKSPAGDPTAYMIRGAVIAIRKEDCRDIFIEKIV